MQPPIHLAINKHTGVYFLTDNENLGYNGSTSWYEATKVGYRKMTYAYMSDNYLKNWHYVVPKEFL